MNKIKQSLTVSYRVTVHHIETYRVKQSHITLNRFTQSHTESYKDKIVILNQEEPYRVKHSLAKSCIQINIYKVI